MTEDMIYELSRMGARHAAAGGENQDALCSIERGNGGIISLADGVSACREAKAGAELASRAITELVEEEGRNLWELDPYQCGERILKRILSRLEERSQAEGRAVEEYSSTVASVLVDRRAGELLYFNLGDGLILGVEGEKCRVLAMPGDSTQGCCVTTTKNAAAAVDVGKVKIGNLERVLICSDGAWRELYRRNRLKPEVYSMLVGGSWGELERFLSGQNCEDDYSVIAMEL